MRITRYERKEMQIVQVDQVDVSIPNGTRTEHSQKFKDLMEVVRDADRYLDLGKRDADKLDTRKMDYEFDKVRILMVRGLMPLTLKGRERDEDYHNIVQVIRQSFSKKIEEIRLGARRKEGVKMLGEKTV